MMSPSFTNVTFNNTRNELSKSRIRCKKPLGTHRTDPATIGQDNSRRRVIRSISYIPVLWRQHCRARIIPTECGRKLVGSNCIQDNRRISPGPGSELANCDPNLPRLSLFIVAVSCIEIPITFNFLLATVITREGTGQEMQLII